MTSASCTLTTICLYPVKSCGGVQVNEASVGPTGLTFDRCWAIVDFASGCVVDQRSCYRLCKILPRLSEPEFLILSLSPQDASECGVQPDLKVPLAYEAYLEGQELTVRDRVEDLWYGCPLSAMSAGDEAAAWISAVVGCWTSSPSMYALVRYSGGRQLCNAFGGRAAVFCEAQDTAAFHDGAPLHLVSEASLAWLGSRAGRNLESARLRANFIVNGSACTEALVEESWRDISVAGVRMRRLAAVPRCEILTVDPNTGLRDARRNDMGDKLPDVLTVLLQSRPPIHQGGFKHNGCFGVFFALAAEGGVVRVGDTVEVTEHSPIESFPSVDPV